MHFPNPLLVTRIARVLIVIGTSMALDCASAIDLAENASTRAQANRTVVANDILNRWEPIAVEAGAHTPAWRELFATQLTAMDDSILRRIERLQPSSSDDARASYAKFARAISGAEMQSYTLAQSGKGPIKLASATTDQVFIPIVPCRIVDTRNVGGPISAGTTRNFLFFTANGNFNWSTQGGASGVASTACPGTINPNGADAPSAAIVTITVVSPSAGGNWVVWGGANPIPTASALNWTGPGQILANTTVIPWGRRSGTGPGGSIQDFAVEYNGPSGSAQFIADVVGYLVENRATALFCTETTPRSAVLGVYNSNYVDGFPCSSNSALTAGNCDVDYPDASYLFGDYYNIASPPNQWSCHYSMASDASNGYQIYASSICCLLPGRN